MSTPKNVFGDSAIFAALRVIAITGLFAVVSRAQVSIKTIPPAALVESSGSVTFTPQVTGTLPGESTAVNWTLNDQQLSTTSRTGSIKLGPGDGPSGVPLILKATSVLDPSKFAAVPVLPLTRSDLAQIAIPKSVVYHPTDGRVYVSAVSTANSTILQIAPDGTQTPLGAPLPTEVIYKLLPYVSSTGQPYLLAVDWLSGTINAVGLSTGNSRRVVIGLNLPVSAAFHPVTGDLYVAETAGRISVIDRTALDSALTGSPAAFRPLSIGVPNISGINFIVDSSTQAVSLLAVSTAGTLYQINLGDNSGVAFPLGLTSAQQLLVLQNPQTGFSFVLTGSAATAGQIFATLPLGTGQPFSPAYALATGLDTVTDLAFVPAGTPYSAAGRSLVLAATRGKIVRWEPDPVVQGDFYSYSDRAQPSLTLVSPAQGDLLLPGAPVEVRWTYRDGNPLNPSSAPPASSTQVLISTDGGSTFSPAGVPFIPSGPQNSQYSQIWQVPASAAGKTIRLAVQMSTPGAASVQATGTWDLNVVDMASASPKPLLVKPNFVVTGQTATVAIDGLNVQGASVFMGDDISVGTITQPSLSRLQAPVQAAATASPGPRTIQVCNAIACRDIVDAFFVLAASHPQITSVSPQGGSPGTTITITGNNFSGVATNNVVMFGNLAATVSKAIPTALTVQVPFGLNRGELRVSVQTNGVPSNTSSFFLVPPGILAPLAYTDGVVNGASFLAGTVPVAPGSIASLFGNNVAPTIQYAGSTPLPTQILGMAVMIGGIPAPLIFLIPTASPGGQIDLQIPEELAGLSSVPLTVMSQGVAGNTIMVNVAPQAPGMFSLDSSGKGPGAVLNQDGSMNGQSNPEHIGNTLQVYCTGLGAVSPPGITGAAPLVDAVPNAVNPPQATIDGVQAQVTFAGRVAGNVGLDQVNVVIPAGVSTGKPVSLVLSSDSGSSNTVTVVVVR